MEILQSSYVPRVGDTLKVSCYVDLDQASTVYPKNIRSSQAYKKKTIES